MGPKCNLIQLLPIREKQIAIQLMISYISLIFLINWWVYKNISNRQSHLHRSQGASIKCLCLSNRQFKTGRDLIYNKQGREKAAHFHI